jgi:hypothetical protein
MLPEKGLGLRDQGREVVEMQGLLAQELTERLAFGQAKGSEPEMAANLLLVRRDGGLALCIRLNHSGGQSEVVGDKGQHIGEQFQGVLIRKAAGEPQKSHLIRQAQAIVGPPAEGELGMVSGRKHNPFGNKLAGVEQRVHHRTVLRITWPPGPPCGTPAR